MLSTTLFEDLVSMSGRQMLAQTVPGGSSTGRTPIHAADYAGSTPTASTSVVWRFLVAAIIFPGGRPRFVSSISVISTTRVTAEGIDIAGMHYRALIIEDEPPRRAKSALGILDDGGRLIRWAEGMSDSEFVRQIDRLVPVDVRVSPMTPELRVRHVVKDGTDCYILFNEGQKDIDVHLQVSAKGQRFWLDAETGRRCAFDVHRTVHIARHEVKILMADTDHAV
jgi:hypothetical protein